MTQDEITKTVGASLTLRLNVSREQGLVVAEATLRALTSAGLAVIDMNQMMHTNQILFALASHIATGAELPPECAAFVETLKEEIHARN